MAEEEYRRSEPEITPRALSVLAYADMRHAEYDRGNDRARQALAMHRASGDRLWEGRTLFVLGVLSRWKGEVDEGKALYHEAIEIGRSLRNPDFVPYAWNGLGNLARNAGDFEEARRCFAGCVAEGIEQEDPGAEVMGLYGIGGTRIDQGEYRKAEEDLLACRARAVEAGYDRFLDSVDGALIFVLRARGEYSRAHELNVAIRRRQIAAGEWREAVSSTVGLVDHYYEVGEYGQAVELINEGLGIAAEHRLVDLQAALNLRLGALYEATAGEADGLTYYLRAYQLSAEANDTTGEINALFYLGRWHRYHGNEPTAIAYYLTVLRSAERQGALLMIRAALQALGNCYLLLGMPSDAEEYFTRSFEVAAQTGDLVEEARAYYAIGAYHKEQEMYEEAWENYNRALAIFRQVESRDLELHLLGSMIELAEAEGNRQEVERLAAERRDLSHLLFSSESARRLDALFTSVETRRARMQGEDLGLGGDDIGRIDRAAATWRSVHAARREKEETAGRAGPESRPRTFFPPPSAAEAGRFGVNTLGTFEVIASGRAVPTTAWKRKRARDLFKLLLIHHRQVVSVSRIEEKLWGKPMEKIESLVANAASHIRSALCLATDATGEGPSLTRVGEGYRLDLGNDALIDFVLFQEQIVAARRSQNGSDRLDHYRHALELFTGEFLPEEPSSWTEHQRMLLNDAWYEAAEFVAREELRRGSCDRAIEVAREILERDSTNESAWSVLLSGLGDRGRRQEAESEFERCRRAFREEFDEDPPTGLLELFSD